MSTPPVPAASFPLPPPLANMPIIDRRTGSLTPLGFSFFTQLWAGIQGGGGTIDQLTTLQAQVNTLYGMSGDATITSLGVITVTSSNGQPFVASAFTDTTNASNITSGTLAIARIADGSVTYAKLQDETDGTLLGRSAGSAGVPMEVTVGNGLELGASGSLSTEDAITSLVTALPAQPYRAGARRFVTDANATTFASIVAGGGANGVPVYSDGTNWRIG